MARYLSLDWDHQQLHVVAAAVGRGGARVQRAAVWHESLSPNPAQAEELGKVLRERLKAAGIAPAPVLVTLGRDRVILKEVKYPQVPDSEEAGIVRFQAVKELTEPANEVEIDYAPLPEPGPNGERRAMALVVRKEVLATYQAICKAAGLKLAGVTPRPFGTLACHKQVVGTTVHTPPPEPADAAVAVLTVGERWAEFCVFRGDAVLQARSLGVNPGLAGEVRRNLAVHAGQSPQHPVRAVYVAGGPADLRERLQDLLAMPIYPLDPFGGAERPELPPADARGTFAGAVGALHLKGTGKKLPIDFANPKQPAPPKDPKKRRAVIGIVLAAAAVLLIIGVGFSELAKKSREISDLLRDKRELETQKAQFDEDAKRIEAIEKWRATDVAWLDELYDLADRLDDTNRIQVASFTGGPVGRTATKYAARMTMEVVTTEDTRHIDKLMNELRTTANYRTDTKKPVTERSGLVRALPSRYQVTVDVNKIPPTGYKRRLPAVAPEEEAARNQERDGGFDPGGFDPGAGFGGMGGFGNFGGFPGGQR